MSLLNIHTVALDAALAFTSRSQQEHFTHCMLTLLERGYQLRLFSSNPKQTLVAEDFSHPQLEWLKTTASPTQLDLARYPELQGENCLWLTNHPHWCALASTMAGQLVTLGEADDAVEAENATTAASKSKAEAAKRSLKTLPSLPALKLSRMWEVNALLDPNGWVMEDALVCIRQAAAMRQQTGKQRPILVGIGGPPASRVTELTHLLYQKLMESEFALCEMLDLSAILPSIESTLTQQVPMDGWQHEASGNWLLEEVLKPLQQQRQIHVASRPQQLHPRWEIPFPLFFCAESVILLSGELLFASALNPWLDVRILLQASNLELTRRLYELPENETFDARFTDSFTNSEGKVYQRYLASTHINQTADLRVDSSHHRVFRRVFPS